MEWEGHEGFTFIQSHYQLVWGPDHWGGGMMVKDGVVSSRHIINSS